jgi:hypothetical protein
LGSTASRARVGIGEKVLRGQAVTRALATDPAPPVDLADDADYQGTPGSSVERSLGHGETDRTLQQALEGAADKPETRTAAGEAATWLNDYLIRAGGCADSADITRDGGAAGHSASTLKRTRTKLGVTASNHGFPQAQQLVIS